MKLNSFPHSMTIFQVLVSARDSSISRFTSLTPYHFQGIRYFGELFIPCFYQNSIEFKMSIQSARQSILWIKKWIRLLRKEKRLKATKICIKLSSRLFYVSDKKIRDFSFLVVKWNSLRTATLWQLYCRNLWYPVKIIENICKHLKFDRWIWGIHLNKAH